MEAGTVIANISLASRTGTIQGELTIGASCMTLMADNEEHCALKVDYDNIATAKFGRGQKNRFCLELIMKNDNKHMLCGFGYTDKVNLLRFFQTIGIVPGITEVSRRGHNSGQLKQTERRITVNDGTKVAYGLHTDDVVRATTSVAYGEENKTQPTGKDLKLEFQEVELAAYGLDLKEIVFFTQSSPGVSDDISKKIEAELDDEHILERFKNITMLNPRHQGTIGFHVFSLRAQWQDGDLKIPFVNINDIYFLEKPNRPFIFVILQIDPMVGTRKTLPDHLIIQFNKNEIAQIQLAVDDARVRNNLINSHKKNVLENRVYDGEIPRIFTELLEKLSNREKIMETSDVTYAFDACLNGQDGHLYSLEKRFVFVPSPLVVISHVEIEYIEFRTNDRRPANRYFDLLFKFKKSKEVQLFEAIANQEHDKILTVLGKNGIRLKFSETFRDAVKTKE